MGVLEETYFYWLGNSKERYETTCRLPGWTAHPKREKLVTKDLPGNGSSSCMDRSIDSACESVFCYYLDL